MIGVYHSNNIPLCKLYSVVIVTQLLCVLLSFTASVLRADTESYFTFPVLVSEPRPLERGDGGTEVALGLQTALPWFPDQRTP